ncbi:MULTISPECIES: EH signature domain-containing protein [unclassified Acinetobacter]|uniref:EH signature domain-containing protein n=1 Tax=unclassified Acinetobacter TaxID=196816 RepID=UPI00244CDDAC|nr:MULTISPECIES: EH signature domain-containing protein [unclassified Acinetobacter]MDH0029964.1 EH signature domain-containing protein [Acinetobacter sp. GD04021]MDH0885205.1 EH signature domain-containing protein [Acinetobacter sp. GD03873]MDH1082152.1 EH signature domain-containing protein [Acinetobacter sp. GD03983]MDH2188355.1 EH signature domain-containing protein [Acinetobacter sp. GD03645]MDH2202123.1 EH signature domain-containing protein [Acinetobacter sp. GD03647]
MSYIFDLQLALSHILEQQQQRELPRPIHLFKVKEKIEERFDPAKAALPRSDAILTAIEKLEKQNLEDLTKRDWRNITWGLCQVYPTRPNKLLGLERGTQILHYMTQGQIDVSQPSLYYPLLYSYFSLDAQETKKTTLIGQNWLVLRDILLNNKQKTQLNMQNIKPWMKILNHYPELLGDKMMDENLELSIIKNNNHDVLSQELGCTKKHNMDNYIEFFNEIHDMGKNAKIFKDFILCKENELLNLLTNLGYNFNSQLNFEGTETQIKNRMAKFKKVLSKDYLYDIAVLFNEFINFPKPDNLKKIMNFNCDNSGIVKIIVSKNIFDILLSLELNFNKKNIISLNLLIKNYSNNDNMKSLIGLFLSDSREIENIAESLKIPEYGWFWHNLITQALDQMCQFNDKQFKQKIDLLLDMAEQRFQRYQTDILVKLLDRYAKTQESYEVNNRLKAKALQIWDDPQNKNNLGWNLVKDDTKQMVIQWFIHADLEAFFVTFAENADEERFKYWLKFVKQIRSSKIFLYKDDYSSKQAKKQEFLRNNKGRYGLINGGSPPTNAFILQIENIFIVEFSKTGNACYFYNKNPVAGRERLPITLNDLKQGSVESAYSNDDYVKCPFKLTHRGDWERNFDRKLRYLGIYTDRINQLAR